MFNNDSMKENLDSIDQINKVRRGTDYNTVSITSNQVNLSNANNAPAATLVSLFENSARATLSVEVPSQVPRYVACDDGDVFRPTSDLALIFKASFR